jgi:hypothetical protein
VQPGPQGRRQRATLRRLAREIRQQDPELARLLSGGPRGIPPLRFTTLPATGYAVIGAVLLLVGSSLGIASAVVWGLAALAAAAVRRRAGHGPMPAPGSDGRGRSAQDQRDSR